MGVDMVDDGSGDDRQRQTPEYRATYERFMAITKWAVIGIAGALIIMALVLV
ncbi:hypothetical protein FHS79_000223 [Polymorphobacter multimanifer]|uniref:Cytochrome c oxidase subunit IV bacterial aa3 type domain-containing protein n=1 Tax=Polymorphobacter multimanifer TaxID=1070431 RepID=A0A841LA98_9SPHN|nr:aa3-type cytochrome c oxidase subunit IV [Polymorphobacter multimanifer]MBB6226072.1 hypothetical protein [Polymorphobacter multimanifer]